MVNSSIKLDPGLWTLIADNVDYLMQNNTPYEVRVKASAALPTSTGGSFLLSSGELVGSSLLSGKVYAMTLKDCYVTVAK